MFPREGGRHLLLSATTELTVRGAIEEFLLGRRLRNFSPQSITWYAKCFGRGLTRYSDVPLSQVTLTKIRGLIAEMMDAGRSAGTVNGTLQAIKALLNWAIEEDIAIGVDQRVPEHGALL